MGATDLAFHGFVSGRVQGVFFRAETRRKAIKLGLSGWVKNLNDGRVEFLISGSEQALAPMRSWLKVGPRLARVDQLLLEQVNLSCEPGFHIHK